MKARPCPFCGSYKLRIWRTEDGSGYWVECREKKCKTPGPFLDIDDLPVGSALQQYKEAAVKLWNNRPKNQRMAEANPTCEVFLEDREYGSQMEI